MSRSADVAIIGGGIIGLALADAVLARYPDSSVVVHDKEARLAAHASGRNSGVLHAGFYYSADSLKARFTRSGNTMLRAFCAERGVLVRETGKVVVARSAQELPALRALYHRGLANGVPVELVDEGQLAELEPFARTTGHALWSPTTAVAEPVAVVEALADRVRQRGGRIVVASEVVSAGPGWLQSRSAGYCSVGHIFNAAGLQADTVAHWFGVGEEYELIPFKGMYWYGNWPPGRLRRHVYPVPNPRNPFLGVHLTVTADGRVKLGPTAIPALWRESYGGVAGFSATQAWQSTRLFARLLRSSHHDVPAMLTSEGPKRWRRHLVKEAAALVPSLRQEDFRSRGRPGIRPQLMHVPENRLEMDLVIRSGPRSTHLLNTVSPGWTSALAIAEHVARQLDQW